MTPELFWAVVWFLAGYLFAVGLFVATHWSKARADKRALEQRYRSHGY